MTDPNPEKWNAHWSKSHPKGHRENPASIISQFDIKDGSTVADLGCGDGYFAIPLIPYVGKQGIIYAIDSNSNALSILRNSLNTMRPESERVKIVEADVSITPLLSHSIDTVIFANIFHDIEDKSKFLKEIRRIVKPSGTIIDIDWHKGTSPLGPPQSMRIDEASAKRLIEEKGFKVIKSIEAGPYHYGLLLGVVFNGQEVKNS